MTVGTDGPDGPAAGAVNGHHSLQVVLQPTGDVEMVRPTWWSRRKRIRALQDLRDWLDRRIEREISEYVDELTRSAEVAQRAAREDP